MTQEKLKKFDYLLSQERFDFVFESRKSSDEIKMIKHFYKEFGERVLKVEENEIVGSTLMNWLRETYNVWLNKSFDDFAHLFQVSSVVPFEIYLPTEHRLVHSFFAEKKLFEFKNYRIDHQDLTVVEHEFKNANSLLPHYYFEAAHI